jgi:hypothetical protein
MGELSSRSRHIYSDHGSTAISSSFLSAIYIVPEILQMKLGFNHGESKYSFLAQMKLVLALGATAGAVACAVLASVKLFPVGSASETQAEKIAGIAQIITWTPVCSGLYLICVFLYCFARREVHRFYPKVIIWCGVVLILGSLPLSLFFPWGTMVTAFVLIMEFTERGRG